MIGPSAPGHLSRRCEIPIQLLWRDVAIEGGPPINTSLTAAETVRLQELAKGRDVLEVGSAYGYSTVALALVAEAVTAVDPHDAHGSFYELQANLNAYGVRPRVGIWRMTSQEFLPKLANVGESFDLIWVDGDHTAEGVEHDVRWAAKLLRPGGWLACHDYDEVTCPGVRQALDKLFGGPGEHLVDTLASYPCDVVRALA